MKLKKIKAIESPYQGIKEKEYQIEKRRLQVELLKIQQAIVSNNQRLAIIFEGRDAAGKGSTIKRFNENMMPAHFRTIELGIPTQKESKHWFGRYGKELPKDGEIVFFDRSWYTRAMIEPAMGYCTESQYKYFMNKVLNWEHKLIQEGTLLVKFYLSISEDTQLFRFENRITDLLTFWKFSKNDLKARKKWQLFTKFKEQMFGHTSSTISPWIVVNANNKKEARLTTMLHLVRLCGNKDFRPLTGIDIIKTQSIDIAGVKFSGLSMKQIAILEELKKETFK